MHERDPQTDFALLRDILGVSRINHILRVDGHTILQEQRAAEIYDEVGQRSLERLFLGLAENSMTQATLSAGQSRIGFEGARDIAAPAHLGSLIATKPRILATFRDAVWAPHRGHRDSHQHPSRKPQQSCMFRKQMAANNLRKGGIRRSKPDHRILRTPRLRFTG